MVIYFLNKKCEEHKNITPKYLPLHDSQALPPNDTAGSGLPLLLPFSTPLLLFKAAGLGLLLKNEIAKLSRIEQFKHSQKNNRSYKHIS